MQSRQGNMLQALRTVDNFLTTNAATLDGVVTTGARKKLADAIATLEATVNEQAGSGVIAKGGTSRFRALRTALIRDHMTPIARIARAELPPTPELSAFRLPKKEWRMERVAAAAHGMALAAEPYSAHFVTAGLPTDFIAQLKGAADAMVRSVSDRKETRGRLSGATKGLATTISSALKLVSVIDAMVTTALVDDPALLANWKVVKRVRRVSAHAPDEKTPPAPVTLPPNANVPGAALPATRTESQAAA
jgi:hypothetical protein